MLTHQRWPRTLLVAILLAVGLQLAPWSPPAPVAAAGLATSCTLYASIAGRDSGGNPVTSSPLYRIDPTNGAVLETIGAIGFAPTGLAVNPTTGTLYGSTSNRSTSPDHLIVIDKVSGLGRLIGPFNLSGNTLADLAFDASGELYGWAEPGLDDLVRVNRVTGAGTAVGNSGLVTSGSGLAISPITGEAFLAGNEANGALRRVDLTTGLTTVVATLTGAPNPTADINALSFNDSGILYGVNGGDVGLAAPARLVTINTTTGVVTDLGPLPPGADALAFDCTVKRSWYFAEGYTGTGFDEYLTIMNPNTTAATVTITYFLRSGPPQTKVLAVGPTSRFTVAVHETQFGVGRGQEVSARVTTDHPGGIVVERPMYFRYTGSMGTVDGGHNVMGTNEPRRVWYVAEGFTGPGFDEYLTILNPSTNVATVLIRYFLKTGPPVEKIIAINPTSRFTVAVHDSQFGVGRNQEVAALVNTSSPEGIVVERPMYFSYGGSMGTVNGGHDVTGTELPRTRWYVAEGYTGTGFDEYLTILNPNNSIAITTITYFLKSGPPVVQNVAVAARSRFTVPVHETTFGVGRNQEVAALVTTTNAGGIIVERPMYFRYTGAIGTVDGGHNVMGAPAPARRWSFAEGYTGPGFEQFLTILNPGTATATVNIRYFLKSGPPVDKTVAVAPTSRFTVAVHDTLFGVGRGQEVSTLVTTTSPDGIVVERPMYFRYIGSMGTVSDGHNVMGRPD